MTNVFVSHARDDAAAARPIVEALRETGLSVLHAEAITPGVPSGDAIEGAIEAAQCVVLLWSKAAARSAFVQAETRLAIQAWSSNRLVLAALDKTPLPVGLRDLSPIPIRGSSDAGAKRLVERVRTVVGSVRIAAPEDTGQSPKAMYSLRRPAPARPPTGARAAGASPLSRRSLLATAAALVVGSAGLAALALRLTMPAEPPRQVQGEPPSPPQSAPAPPAPEPTTPGTATPPPSPASPSISLIVMLLAAGAAIGAAAAWAFTRTRRSHARADRPPPAAPSRLVADTSEGSRPQQASEPSSGAPLRPASEASADVPQVFVSYSRRDQRAVYELVRQIEQLGYAIWIDRQSTGSQRYAAPIVRAIKTSRLVALMCSENAFASDHVIREVYVAGDYKKPFIAFQLDPTELPDEVLYFVSGFPRVSITSIDTQQLRSEIARLVDA